VETYERKKRLKISHVTFFSSTVGRMSGSGVDLKYMSVSCCVLEEKVSQAAKIKYAVVPNGINCCRKV